MKRDKHDLSEEVNSDYKIKPSNMNWVKPIKMSRKNFMNWLIMNHLS